MKTEKVFGGILLVGLFFKFMNWPFAGAILVVGLGVPAMLYLIASFYFFSDKEIKRQNLALSIISGIFLMNACNGILFKLMFWPFSGPTLMYAVTTVPVILAITLWLKSTTKRTDLTTYYKNMVIRLSVWTFLVVLFYFTSSITLVKIIHSNDPRRVELQTKCLMYPENEEYREQLSAYLRVQRFLENSEESNK